MNLGLRASTLLLQLMHLAKDLVVPLEDAKHQLLRVALAPARERLHAAWAQAVLVVKLVYELVVEGKLLRA